MKINTKFEHKVVDVLLSINLTFVFGDQEFL